MRRLSLQEEVDHAKFQWSTSTSANDFPKEFLTVEEALEILASALKMSTKPELGHKVDESTSSVDAHPERL